MAIPEQAKTQFGVCLLSLLALLFISGCREQNHFETDDIVYLAEGDNGRYQLFTIDPDGRTLEPKQLTTQYQDIFEFAISPDKHIAFTQKDDDQSHDIWLLWNNTDETLPLAICDEAGACQDPRWSPTQNLFIYEVAPIREDTIMTRESKLWWYDLEAFQIIPVFSDENWFGQDVRFSADGKRLSYIVPIVDEIQIFNLSNGEVGGIQSRANVAAVWGGEADLYFSALTVSHDRTSIHIFKTDPTGEEVINLSGNDAAVEDGGYVPSPDGTLLAFTRKPPRGSVGRQIWLMDNDGSNQRSLTDNLSIQHGALSWNSTGTQLLYQQFDLSDPNAEPEIWIVDAVTGERNFVTKGTRPQFSP